MNTSTQRQELLRNPELKDPLIARSDAAIMKKNGVRNESLKAGAVLVPYLGGVGAFMGSGISEGLKTQGIAPEILHPRLKGFGRGKFMAVGGAAGAVAGVGLSLLAHKSIKDRRDGLKKYPKSFGEAGVAGYSASYPQNSALPTLKQYFKKPKELSARDELETILFGELEDRDKFYHKAGRIAATAAVGGLAGRLAAWKPLTGGKMNRATLIGAGIGAASQGAFEHIAASKKGIYGSKITSTDESRKSTRSLGGVIPNVGLAGGLGVAYFRAAKEASEANSDNLRAGLASSLGGKIDEDVAARIQKRAFRASGFDRGETFIPKLPKFARGKEKVAGQAGYRGVDHTGGDIEDKLRRLAEDQKGTPEGDVAARKLHEIRSKAGKTFGGKVRRVFRKARGGVGSAFEKVASKFRSPQARKAIGMLLSAREELDDIMFGTRDEEKGLGTYAVGAGGIYAGGRLGYRAAPMVLGKQRFYHGTSKSNAARISEEGLRSEYGGINGSSAHVGSDQYIKNSTGKVHVSQSRRIASGFATLNGISKDASLHDKRAALNRGFLTRRANGGAVISGHMPYGQFKSAFEVDPDMRIPNSKIQVAFRTTQNIGKENIGRGSLLRGVSARSVADYARKHPGRFGMGLGIGALGAAGIAGGAHMILAKPTRK